MSAEALTLLLCRSGSSGGPALSTRWPWGLTPASRMVRRQGCVPWEAGPQKVILLLPGFLPGDACSQDSATKVHRSPDTWRGQRRWSGPWPQLKSRAHPPDVSTREPLRGLPTPEEAPELSPIDPQNPDRNICGYSGTATACPLAQPQTPETRMHRMSPAPTPVHSSCHPDFPTFLIPS